MRKSLSYTLSAFITLSLTACSQSAAPAQTASTSVYKPLTQLTDTKQVSAAHAADGPKASTAAGRPAQNKNIQTINVPLVKVVDGDTIKVTYNGKNEEVRFLLIDTPETHHPTKPVQPFGPEAEAYVKQLFNGQTSVNLELGQGRDKYDRLLAYVYLPACPKDADTNKLCEIEGRSVAKMELAKGLARVAYIYEPNTKYVDDYRKIEDEAKQQKIGIWSIDHYVQEDGYHPEVQANTAAKQAEEPKSEPVTAAQPSTAKSAPAGGNVYYRNCTAVKAAGKAPLHRGDPGYRLALDRDNDGIACEK